MNKGPLELELHTFVDSTEARKEIEDLQNAIGHVEESLYHLEDILHRIEKIPIEIFVKESVSKKGTTLSSFLRVILISGIIGIILGLLLSIIIPFPF